MRGRSQGRGGLLRGLALIAIAACNGPTDDATIPLEAARVGTAAAGDPTVDAVDPPAATQDTTLDVRVLGSNYDRGSTAEFLIDGASTPKVVTNSTRYRNPGEVVANITIAADAVLAAYDVMITTSRGKKGIGIEKFVVNPKGRPPSCPDPVAVTISGLSGALISDGGSYSEINGIVSHINGVNGNLMFNVRSSNPARTVTVTTSAGSAARSTRIYTNTHSYECGLLQMDPAGEDGTGVLEVEFNDASWRYTLRYGKNCVGDFGTVVPANLIDTHRSGNIWTLSGDAGEGILCRGKPTGKANWTQIGTANAFTMTLQGSP